MQNKRTPKGQTATDPFDAPDLMGVEISIHVLANGIASVRAVMFTKVDDPNANALEARYTPLISKRARELGEEISKMVSGDSQSPDVIPMGSGESGIAPSPLLKFDRRGGKA